MRELMNVCARGVYLEASRWN